jgi:hypothetical protein
MTKRDAFSLPEWTRRGSANALLFGVTTFLPTGLALAELPLSRDLTPTIIHHEARCPSPAQGKCLIGKPVGTGYRVLTPGLDLEDAGDHWIADFSKGRNAKTPPSLMRIMDRHEVLHEIALSFPNEPAASATSAGKSSASSSAASSAKSSGKSASTKKKLAKSKAKPKKSATPAPAQPAN